LLTYSEDFTNAAWTKTGVTVSANQIIAPDGTLTMDKLVENTSTSTHVITAFSAIPSAGTWTLSIRAKKAERSRLYLGNASGTTNYAIFDLSSGTYVSNIGTGTAVLSNPSIRSVGNDIYQVSITLVTTGALTIGLGLIASGTTTSYTGDGYSGIYIWGAQLEAGAFATPYIPTVAAQVTRLADSAVMTGVNFSSWFNPEQGCLQVNYIAPNNFNSQSAIVLGVSGFGAENRIAIFPDASGSESPNTGVFQVVVNSVSQALIAIAADVDGSDVSVAVVYKVDDFAVVKDGGSVTTDTNGILPVVDRASIGSNGSAGLLNGYIKRLTYYPQALTSANLQAITR
jgi:hypothetical protein